MSRGPRTCSICHEEGHDARKCPQRSPATSPATPASKKRSAPAPRDGQSPIGAVLEDLRRRRDAIDTAITTLEDLEQPASSS